MKPITCLVVDDEAAAITTLKSYIEATEGLIYQGGIQDPFKAKVILSDNNALPELVFLDMEMKGITGDQLAKDLSGKTMIVFSTAHPDFAVQSYEYGAIDYLLKPFSYERFLKAIEKCKRFKASSANLPDKDDFVTIPDTKTGKLIIVEKNKINYITAFGNYCKVFLEDGQYLMPLKSLVSIYTLLKSEQFLRVHRTWVIHIKQVLAYNNDSVTLKNGDQVKLGRVYKAAFKKWIELHTLKP